jgi:hypothetical protein
MADDPQLAPPPDREPFNLDRFLQVGGFVVGVAGVVATWYAVTRKPPPKPRVLPKLRGDYLRLCFTDRLERRHTVHH